MCLPQALAFPFRFGPRRFGTNGGVGLANANALKRACITAGTVGVDWWLLERTAGETGLFFGRPRRVFFFFGRPAPRLPRVLV